VSGQGPDRVDQIRTDDELIERTRHGSDEAELLADLRRVAEGWGSR
jgi:hypothetical protein